MKGHFPLDWPESHPRTHRWARKSSAFNVSFAKARADLGKELILMRSKDPIISSNIPVRNDGLPYATAKEPDDPGIAVYFAWRGTTYVVACDAYRKTFENLRAIGLTVASLRAIGRYGATGLMEQAFAGFAALPPPQATDWRKVLGFAPGAKPSLQKLLDTFRELAQVYHPDKGGNPNEMIAIIKAKDAAMKELSLL